MEKNPILAHIPVAAGAGYLTGAVVGVLTRTSLHQSGVILTVASVASTIFAILIDKLGKKHNLTPDCALIRRQSPQVVNRFFRFA